jgi:4-diphosphocytidyl-2-C-methyl-D-erythritol kinase
MILKSYAKINLTLRINKKLKNKLHDLQTYFCLIDLFDEIKIKKIRKKKDNVKFIGRFANNIDKKNNSILKTLGLLRKNKIITDNYSVLVNKKIPVFAGLGGGTSNAVCLIKYFSNKNNKYLQSILSKKIGSDTKLFFYNIGFLKNLREVNIFKIKYKLNFLLIFPNLKCSTRYIYSKVKKYSHKNKHKISKINNKSKFTQFLSNEANDLQSIVEKKYLKVKKLLIEISQEKGCLFSRMSGSGSVCYGIFKSKKTAKDALKRIKLKYPKYWLSVAKTI